MGREENTREDKQIGKRAKGKREGGEERSGKSKDRGKVEKMGGD